MSLQLKLRVGLLIIIIITTLLIVQGYRNYQKVLETSLWVSHTQEVLFENEDVLTALVDMETGARGYAITGNEEYLHPYNNSRNTVNKKIENLITLTHNNPIRYQQFKHLQQLTLHKAVINDSIVKLTKTQGKQAAQDLITTEIGKDIMDSIRTVFSEIQNSEKQLLTQREQQNEKQVRDFNNLLIGALICILLIIALLAYSINTNLKARLKAEKFLKEYQHFFNNSNDMCGIANMHGSFEIINSKFETVLGYTDQEFLAHPFFYFIHPDDIAATEDEVEKLSQGATTINFANRYRKKDGSYVWLEWHATPVTATGKLYAIARDITERKKAEEQIKETNKELEAFSYSVSHDLRAPLRAINGFSDILAQKYGETLNPEAKRLLGVIKTNAIRMGNLIDDLLAFSRTGRKEVSLSLTDMQSLVYSAINELCQNENEKMKLFTLKQLPPAQCDMQLIRQVWINLISNAIKYSSKKEKPEIEIGATEKNGELIYYIKDNGAGFDMEYADKLFGVFQRLHSQQEFEGNGVGLALVQRIITKHKGRMWAEAALDKGATFYFTLTHEHVNT
jgi:PAS domain S-box-containing protein